MGQGQGGWKPPEGPVTKVRCRCGAIQLHCVGTPDLHFYEHAMHTREWFFTDASPVEMVAWKESQVFLVKGQESLMVPVIAEGQQEEENTQRTFCGKCWARLLCRQKQHAFISVPFSLISETDICNGVHLGSAPYIHLNCLQASAGQKAYLALPSSFGGPKIAKYDHDLDPVALGLIAGKASVNLLGHLKPGWSKAIDNVFRDQETKIKYDGKRFLGTTDLAGKIVFLSPGCLCCDIMSPAEETRQVAANAVKAEERRKKKQEKIERRRSSLGLESFGSTDQKDRRSSLVDMDAEELESRFQGEKSGLQETLSHPFKGRVWLLQFDPETYEVFYNVEQLDSDKGYIFRVSKDGNAIGWRVKSTNDGKAASRLLIDGGKVTMEGDDSIVSRRLYVFPDPDPTSKGDQDPTVDVDLDMDIEQAIGSGVLRWANPVNASAARDKMMAK